LKKAPGKGFPYSDYRHTRITDFSDADWEGSLIDRRSLTGYCVSFRENLLLLKNKKQSVVSRFSVESEYRAIVNMTYELVWIENLLTELGLASECPIRLYCIHIVVNPVFHERTKQIEANCHVVHQKIAKRLFRLNMFHPDIS